MLLIGGVQQKLLHASLSSTQLCIHNQPIRLIPTQLMVETAQIKTSDQRKASPT